MPRNGWRCFETARLMMADVLMGFSCRSPCRVKFKWEAGIEREKLGHDLENHPRRLYGGIKNKQPSLYCFREAITVSHNAMCLTVDLPSSPAALFLCT